MVDYEELSRKTLGEVGTSITTEGGGVAAGFVGAGFIGRQVQKVVKTDADVTANPTWMNYALAWGGNNLPKALIWYFTRGYAIAPGEAATPIKEAISDARKAFAGSIVFDTLMRLMNKGINPASAYIGTFEVLGSSEGVPGRSGTGTPGTDVQRVLQENFALRTENNKLAQTLIAAGIPLESLPITPKERQRKYGAMTPEEVAAEQAAQAAQAATVLQTPRQRKYAFMKGMVEGSPPSVASQFGML